jgi:hypothetical protein
MAEHDATTKGATPMAATTTPNQVPLYTVSSDTRSIRRGQRVAIIGTAYTEKGLVFRVVGEQDLHRPDRSDYWDVFEVRAHLLVPVESAPAR